MTLPLLLRAAKLRTITPLVIVIGLTLMTLAGFVVVPFFWMTVWRLRKLGGPG